MNRSIDINCDVGERPEAITNGSEEQLIRLISSANVACGAHAGDESTMEYMVRLTKRYGVALGAHPAYPDRTNFGRIPLNLSLEEIEQSVFDQLLALKRIAEGLDVQMKHVKPHGALYNVAANDMNVAGAIGRAVLKADKSLMLFGLAGYSCHKFWEGMGLRTIHEAFADRVYESDGSLRSRTYDGALITDPHRAANQALTIIKEKNVVSSDGKKIRIDATSICVHSDTPNSLAILSAVREKFITNEFRISFPP